MTSDNETNLLTHLFSLCLKIDDYATDTKLIAADLKMSTTRYVTFSCNLHDRQPKSRQQSERPVQVPWYDVFRCHRHDGITDFFRNMFRMHHRQALFPGPEAPWAP